MLTEWVRVNTSIDWTIKESARSKLKVIVKRALRQYGYPPDMQKLATETALKQAELIAEELARPIELLIAAQPTRGLNVGSIEFIHRSIIKQRDERVATLLALAELDEILAPRTELR